MNQNWVHMEVRANKCTRLELRVDELLNDVEYDMFSRTNDLSSTGSYHTCIMLH
jgi:hypothetical protein